MKFSLLSRSSDMRSVPCEIIYDLSIDRAVKSAVGDGRCAGYFLEVLSAPPRDIADTLYRRRIYEDFEGDPALFEELKTLFARYDKIKSDWNEMKPPVPVSDAQTNAEALLEYTFSSLKVTSLFPSTIESFYKSFAETIAKHDVRSEGLKSIGEYCREMTENRALGEIVRISKLFRYKSPEDFDFRATLELDSALRVADCEMSLISEHAEEKKSWNPFAKKKSDGSIPVVRDGSETDAPDDGAILLNLALADIDSALKSVTNGIYDTFFGLSREIMFYEAALKIRNLAKETGANLAMPEMLSPEEDTLCVEGLCDLLLLSQTRDSGKIVRNDAKLLKDNCGIIIRGATDSGKTVYLRSIGTAQLFAQSGLPILADGAKLSIRAGLFSHFSSAEEKFVKGDIAGRFESEAKAVAHIVDEIAPHSLALFNETFQTTSYAEGTLAMSHILNVFPKLGSKFVFVTHLTKIFDLMKDNGVVKATTSEDKKYKITT